MGFAALYPSYGSAFQPDGQISKKLSSPVSENIPVFINHKSRPQLAHPVPPRGALAIVANAGQGAVDAAVSGARN
jgi:hypothetical protein